MKNVFLLSLALGVFLVGLVGTAGATSLINAGFEEKWTNSDTRPGYVYEPTGPNIGWAFAGGAGVSKSDTAWNGTAQEGTQFAFLQGISSISQDFTLSSTSDISVDFFWALRPGYDIGQQLTVSVDGVQIDPFDVSTTAWTNSVLNLGTFGAGLHSLTFAGIIANQGIDTSAFIDNIQLNSTPSPIPEPATMLLFGVGLIGFAGVGRRKK